MTRDLTKGSPIINLILFSIPLIAGTIFQQFYNFADTIMIGRLVGADALGAVGVSYPLNFLILGFVQGFTIGLGIPLAHAMGAKDKTDFNKYFYNALYICLAISIILTFSTLLFSKELLKLIKTPAEIFDMAKDYIFIIFSGIPFSVLYNYSASVLRSNGDSKHPFYFLVATNFLNIILDYIFIGYFNLGVKGAALATIMCQAISTILNIFFILKKTNIIELSKSNALISNKHIKELIKNALPMGLEYSFSSVGAIIMQSAINTLGTAVITGQTAGEKIRQLFTLPMESVGMAQAMYTGQNWGAKEYKRIKQGIVSGILIQFVYCVVCFIVIFLLKNLFTSIVLGNEITSEFNNSVKYLSVISCFFIFHGSLMILRNTLQGMGYSIIALLSGVCEIIGRGIGSLLAIETLGFFGICLANPFAWILALIFCSLAVFHYLHLKLKQQS
ncbi:MATE family efflux transporter [Treponema pectinovorum]|uniref:MATE family efflux transporter n=1 Tax=Treponema pectinovorum TaxID=164 RepID=UPI0011CA923A|nr:MATE family efflux transporter [Treponema pectinovorum]